MPERTTELTAEPGDMVEFLIYRMDWVPATVQRVETEWYQTGGSYTRYWVQVDGGSLFQAVESHIRKAASAMIAKIPFALSSYIARVYKP